VDEWLPQRHLARFVVEVIDGLELSELVNDYRGSGSAGYHPALLLALLMYGYVTKVFSSRALERAIYDSVAFRFIAGNEHPDHDTIAAFRKRFIGQIEPLFIEVLKLARAMGMLKLGTVALDGTNIHANASRHSALSYGHVKKLEKQLKREVKQLLRLAEQAEHQAKLAAREAHRKRTGKNPRGRPPQPPIGGVHDQYQISLTDEDRASWPPLAVDSLSCTTPGGSGDREPADRGQLRMLADNGYLSQANVEYFARAKIASAIHTKLPTLLSLASLTKTLSPTRVLGWRYR